MPSIRDRRSRSCDRRVSHANEPPPIISISGHSPFKAESKPMDFVYQEVPIKRYQLGIPRTGEGLSKSQSMSSSHNTFHRPFIMSKICSSLSKLKRFSKPESHKDVHCGLTYSSSPSLGSTSVTLLPRTSLSQSRSLPVTSSVKTSQRYAKKDKAKDSVSSEDFLCAICLDIFYRPRILSCGHAFCLTCLQSYSNACSGKFSCPTCRQTIELPPNGVSELPRNFHFERTVEERKKALTLAAKICLKCHGEMEVKECGHCNKGWCNLCYPSHVKEVKEEFVHLRESLEESKERLLCKKEEEETRFNNLEQKITETIEMRKDELISKVRNIRERSQRNIYSLSEEVDKTLSKFSQEEKQQTSMEDSWNEYKDVKHLLASVSSSMDPRLTFDTSLLTLSSTDEGPTEGGLLRRTSNVGDEDPEEDDDERLIIPKDHSALYRKKSSYSKFRWGQNVCRRPAGVAISPWSGYLYVIASDSCKIHCFDLHGKQLSCFGSRGSRDGGFLCPIGIAFSLCNKELYITDKWKHCIHVFNTEGHFLRQMGKKGKGFGEFSSPEGIATDLMGNIYVADTCNDRVQILDQDGVFLREVGMVTSEIFGHGHRYILREFNEPVGVAVSPNGSKIYVADSGNHRIRVFDGYTGERLLMFGSRGYNRGQFESPESILVDNEGFIIVGDSGNGRVQIFRPNGRFIRALGTKSNKKGEFGWVSGIALTKSSEIIVADYKNNTIAVF